MFASGLSALAIEPAGSVSPATAAVSVLVVGWCVSCLFAFAAWRFIVYRGRALRAESVGKLPPRLEEGPALLEGRVETDDGGPAVRIEIDQVGREWSRKGGYTHEWQEKNRVVHVRPFHLRLANDELVRVLPDERVRIVDDLETERFEGIYRRRVCELSARERVWVSGVLAREGHKAGASTAYRAGPTPLVLKGTAMEPLEVASGSLDRQFSYWKKFYGRATTLLGAALFLVHVLLFGPYYARLWAGKVETTTVTRTNTYITTHKNGSTTHYVVYARLPAKAGGLDLHDEVDYKVHDAAKDGTLKTVPFLHVRAIPSLSAIGRHATLSFVSTVASALVALLAAIALPWLRRRAMPWYEQSRVIEQQPGRLDDNPWDKQVPGAKGLFVPGKQKP